MQLSAPSWSCMSKDRVMSLVTRLCVIFSLMNTHEALQNLTTQKNKY